MLWAGGTYVFLYGVLSRLLAMPFPPGVLVTWVSASRM
jgi:hypothetical protein